MKRTLFGGPGLIVIAALLWAVDGIIRRSLFSLPPIAIVFYEHLFGALLIAPFFFRKAKGERLRKSEWGAIVWVSLLSGVLGTLWFTTALAKVNFISFSVVFLLQKLQPIFAIGTGKLFLKEKLSSRYLLWAGVALIAAYFVTFKNGIVNFETGAGTIGAALFAFGAAFAWGSSTAFSRYSLLKHSGTYITGLRFFITTLLSLPLLFILSGTPSFPALDASQLGRLVVIALSTGMVALWIYYQGLKRTQTKVATILELVFPLVAVIIDIFLYKTLLAPSQYIAAAVLLFAAYRVAKLNGAAEYRYVVSVIAGRGKGKEIGFPTLNLKIPRPFSHQYGIYAGWVEIDGKKHMAAIHYGPIPVFGQKESSLEAYVLDTEIHSPPREITLFLGQYLRDIRSFPDNRALGAQIAKDVEETRAALAG